MEENIFNELIERSSNKIRPYVIERINDGLTYDEALLIIDTLDLCDQVDNIGSLKETIPLMDKYVINKINKKFKEELGIQEINNR